MKQGRRISKGMGIAVLLAGFTLAIAVLSGIFLIRDWGSDLQPYAPLEWPGPAPVAVASSPPHTDHLRAKPQRLAKLPHSHRGNRA